MERLQKLVDQNQDALSEYAKKLRHLWELLKGIIQDPHVTEANLERYLNASKVDPVATVIDKKNGHDGPISMLLRERFTQLVLLERHAKKKALEEKTRKRMKKTDKQ